MDPSSSSSSCCSRGSGGAGRGRDGDGGRVGGGRGRTQAAANPTNPLPAHPVLSEGGGASRVAGPRRPESSGAGGRRTWAAFGQPHPKSPLPDIQPLKISEQRPTSLPESSENRMLPMKRPDRGGTLAVRSIQLLVNHFPVAFNPQKTIIQYEVDIKQELSPGSWPVKRFIPKCDMRLIVDKLFSDNPDLFPIHTTAYDGGKNVFSAVLLPTGKFKVGLSDGEGMKTRSYIITFNLVNELLFSKLKDYLSGNPVDMPRDILQGMDLVMQEHPSRHRITFWQAMYSKEYRREDDLECGVAAYTGARQRLKLTSQGLALSLDSFVLAFYKRLPVIDFLMEHVEGFEGVNDIRRLMRQVTYALKGLQVNVIHCATNQMYTIAGLTPQNTRDLSFTLEDPEGKDPPREVDLVDYFREYYGKEIMYKDIPCLDIGKGYRENYVPMEFCILVEGQRFPVKQLNSDALVSFQKIKRPTPRERKNVINEMVQADDGPCGGDVIQNFEIEVDPNMTRVKGRVMEPPDLKLGSPDGKIISVRVDMEKCEWNLFGNCVVEGISVERWALIDFSSRDHDNKLIPDNFIRNLMGLCRNLGIFMEEPLVCRYTDMNAFFDANRLRQLLESVMKEASGKGKGHLQIIICLMVSMHDNYKYLKWVSETQVGVLTLCCLSGEANKEEGKDELYAKLAIKINAKLGGSNFELIERLPRFEGEDHVMFIGAEVDEPGLDNSTGPSIAAVVATVNWPSINRYAARICPQDRCTGKILNFGTMCLDLVNTYERMNKVKPKKIVVFRDGASESQIDMFQELRDLKGAIYEEHYRPTITLVVVQTQRQTRLFPENEKDGGEWGNVPPGTVVDTTVVHPFEFDFYLCSHYERVGTTHPAHYYVLYDDHGFTSDQMQKLAYNLCFTCSHCTEPLRIVLPVYYANLALQRGRIYQGVVMSLQPPPLASSSSLAASFDDRFYKPHPELQNSMFFI